MKLLFTSYHYQHLFGIYDTLDDSLTYVESLYRTYHRPFGISWSDTRLFIAQPNSIVSLPKDFSSQTLLVDGLSYGIHQILCRDGFLFFVSPQIDSLGRIDLTTGKTDYLYLAVESVFQKEKAGGHDIHHFNSIYIGEDRAFVSAHNKEQPSFVIEFEYPSFQRVQTHYNMGCKIHGVYVEDHEIYTLDSQGSRSIISNRGHEFPVGEKGMFVRGFCATPEVFVAGYFPELTRHKRNTGDSFIALIDRQTGQKTKEIRIADIGSISDLRILDQVDLVHNGRPFYDAS